MFKLLLYFHIIFRFLEASKTILKSKSLSLFFVFSRFFEGQKVKKTVLPKSIRKDDKLDFCVVNNIALIHWVISDLCQN